MNNKKNPKPKNLHPLPLLKEKLEGDKASLLRWAALRSKCSILITLSMEQELNRLVANTVTIILDSQLPSGS